MTTLVERTPSVGRSGNGRGYRLPAVARGRRPLVAVASAALVVASMAIFASIYSSADHRIPVLLVTSTIRPGQAITASQLGTVAVAASGGLSEIPVADASELTGTWATVTIPAGSLISRDDVTSSRPLARGSAVVGLALKDGQLPASGVDVGDRVMIVETPAAGSVLPAGGATDGSDPGTGSSAGNGDEVLVAQATVFQTTTPAASSASGAAELVSVTVPRSAAAEVASASASSQVSLVLLPDQGASTPNTSSSASTTTTSGSS